MTEEGLIAVLAKILAQWIGRYLGKYAAPRLYAELARVDKEALDDLLVRYDKEAP